VIVAPHGITWVVYAQVAAMGALAIVLATARTARSR
jgi:hypothetical protein